MPLSKEERKRLEHFERQIAARKKWKAATTSNHKSGIVYRETTRYPSATGTGGTERVERQHYTGTEVIGIGVMHKSNLVPVTKGDELRHMRR